MIEKLPTDYNVRTICNLKNMSKVAVEISSHRTTKLERERESNKRVRFILGDVKQQCF